MEGRRNCRVCVRVYVDAHLRALPSPGATQNKDNHRFLHDGNAKRLSALHACAKIRAEVFECV